MLKQNSFDTVCHEHLSYYGMRQPKYIMDTAGFKIVDFEFNDVNGGSISVVVTPSTNSERKECTTKLTGIIALELEKKLTQLNPGMSLLRGSMTARNSLRRSLISIRVAMVQRFVAWC